MCKLYNLSTRLYKDDAGIWVNKCNSGFPFHHFPLTSILKLALFSDRMLQVGPFQTSWVLPNAVDKFHHRLLLPKLEAQGITSAISLSDLFLGEADR